VGILCECHWTNSKPDKIYLTPPTPTPEINWTGTLITFDGPPGGAYETMLVVINQSNSSINGSFSFADASYSINGALSTDKKTMSGTFDSGAIGGSFVWYWLNQNQFNGNIYDGGAAWCGFRESAGQPSPCLSQ